MEDNSQSTSDWHDTPSADPQIQLDYEASLGAFFVAFNRIDNTVSDIIFMALQKSERSDIQKRIGGDSFHRKMITLDLLSLAYPGPLPRKLIDELRDLASRRNFLAHGHFHQNPFDGSYEIATDRTAGPMPTTELDQLTGRADNAWNDLRYAQAYFWFDDLDASG